MGKGGRVFLRGITSESYGLREFRRRQLAAPRVRDDTIVVDDGKVGHSGDSAQSRTWWRIGPGDEPFLTQSLQVHFVELPPRSSNTGHGHQNEAAFCILDGAGYEIHDDRRYDGAKDDLVLVHTDSVHRHFNLYDETVLPGRQGQVAVDVPRPDPAGAQRPGGRGAPVRPSGGLERAMDPDVADRRKVVKPADTPWETTPLGRVRVLSSPLHTDVRTFSVDAFVLDIPAGSRSGRRWHMADEVLYVLSGIGHSLHWEVEAEIAEMYYARAATAPTRHEIKAGDTLYVPHNTVAWHFATGREPLVLLSGQNRIFKLLGYDNTVYLEPAPEYGGAATRSGV